MSTLSKSAIDFSLPYKVKDMSLAEWGRKEIKLAEVQGLPVVFICPFRQPFL